MNVGYPSRSATYPSAWVAAFAGPIAWCINLESVYALTPRACAAGDRMALHLSTVVCLGLALGGAALAWLNWAWAGRRPPSETEDGWSVRVAFMSQLGLMSASLFALAIVAQWVAIVSLDPCPR